MECGIYHPAINVGCSCSSSICGIMIMTVITKKLMAEWDRPVSNHLLRYRIIDEDDDDDDDGSDKIFARVLFLFLPAPPIRQQPQRSATTRVGIFGKSIRSSFLLLYVLFVFMDIPWYGRIIISSTGTTAWKESICSTQPLSSTSTSTFSVRCWKPHHNISGLDKKSSSNTPL